MEIKNILYFIGGCLVGSAITAKFLQNYYDELSKEEIEAVKEQFNAQTQKSNTSEEKKVNNKPPVSEVYKQMTSNYTNYSKAEEEHPQEDGDVDPYTISPDEFSDHNDYEKKTYIYYRENDLLIDDSEEIIHDRDGDIGEGSLEKFGEYEPDVVYVRNENISTDFEILLQEGDYFQELGNPYITQDEEEDYD